MNFLRGLFLVGETPTPTGTDVKTFVDSIIAGITGQITLAQIATVIAAIIAAGIVAIFAWKYARKGYKFVKDALSNGGGKF